MQRENIMHTKKDQNMRSTITTDDLKTDFGPELIALTLHFVLYCRFVISVFHHVAWRESSKRFRFIEIRGHFKG
jgi:hypothetical protein